VPVFRRESITIAGLFARGPVRASVQDIRERERREPWGKQASMLRCTTKGGEQKVGILEDTLMSEKEARERAGRLQETNRASADGSARTPPIGANASGTLRGILHGSRKASPSAWSDVKPYLKLPAKSVGDTLAGTSGGRDGLETVGELFVDLKLEGLDATQMDHLGGVTDEMLAAQMEILAENEVSDSGEETVGGNSEDEESFSGRGTHNPTAPEFKSRARIVYLGQDGDEMILGYVVTVHGDGKVCPPFYTAYLEGFGEKQVEVHRLFPVAAQDDQPPPMSVPVPSHSSSRTSQSRKDRKEKKEYLKQMSEMSKIMQHQRL
jgi:hypothetical protein